MPKKTTDYSKMVIYKIQHIDVESLVYVGSTTDFTGRKSYHKNVCNNPNHKEHNNKKYKLIRDNGGWDEFRMVIIKKFPCNNKREAETEEEECRKELKANMNTVRCFVSTEERKKKDILSSKNYRETHKEYLKSYHNEYDKTHKQERKNKCKNFYESHKQELKAKQKGYYETHKEELKAKNRANSKYKYAAKALFKLGDVFG